MEKQSEFPPRRRVAQYGFVEQTYLSLKEHNAIVSDLNKKLESAKEALKKIGVDDYTVFYGMGTFVDVWRDKTFLMNKIAKECLKKLEE